MVNLKRILSAIDRTERNKINENYDEIESEFSRLNRDVSNVVGLSDEAKITASEAIDTATDALSIANNIDNKATQAINTANAATTKSNAAVNTANEALQKSESTQTQLDTIVISGDSSVEAAQARVGTDGTAHDTLKARIDSEISGVATQLAQSKDESIQRAKVNRNKTKRPTLVITLDDGRSLEYSRTIPLLESLGVKATFYHNTGPNLPDRLTESQIKEMHAKGHEFGSHTRNHIYLGEARGKTNFAIGATQIVINNTTNYKFFDVYDIETKLRILDGTTFAETEVVITNAVLTGNDLTITLANPLSVAISNPFVSYATSFIRKQFEADLDFFDELNIPCTHLAYPYGVNDARIRTLAAEYYVSARGAFDMAADANLVTVNGGNVRNVETAIEQFAISCGDLGGSKISDIDNLLNTAVTRNGMVVLLGHAANYDAWATQLTHAVNKARQLGFDIKTMSEALQMHGNTQSGDFRLSPNGNPRGAGVDIRPMGSVATTENANNFKEGITIVSAETSDSKAYPTANGTLVHLRSTSNVEHLGWGKDIWIDKNSHKMWVRRNINQVTYSDFKRIIVEGEQIILRQYTIPSVTIATGGTYSIPTGIIVGTNDVTFDFTERYSNNLSVAMFKGVVINKRVRDGELRIDMINTSAANITTTETVVNMVIHLL